jgi:hypothetical protein
MDDDASKWRRSASYEHKMFTESRETVWETKGHVRLESWRYTYYKFTRQERVKFTLQPSLPHSQAAASKLVA